MTAVVEEVVKVEQARLSVLVPAEDQRRLEALAELHHRTLSQETRLALDEHFARHAGVLAYALRPVPETVELVGADGRRLLRGVSREYAEGIKNLITLETGEQLQVVAEHGSHNEGEHHHD